MRDAFCERRAAEFELMTVMGCSFPAGSEGGWTISVPAMIRVTTASAWALTPKAILFAAGPGTKSILQK
jgi:hypothetical protein